MTEISISRFSSSLAGEWDSFVDTSKNGTFLLRRDYMDYHSDRFSDFSLVARRGNSLYALLPGCRVGNSFRSHAGLTYGGLVMSVSATAADILAVMTKATDFLRAEGFEELVCSPAPHIYHRIPAEEDLYALFRLGATLSARKISSVILQSARLPFRSIRKAGIRKAMARGVTLDAAPSPEAFWSVLEANLMSRYSVKPVHSLSEIRRLMELFPDNIRLHTVSAGAGLLAGVLVYLTPEVAHCQYISASPEGKECGALDFLMASLINDIYADRRYFDFGNSNEENGRVLNENLIYQKEGFGARAVCYDTYTLPL